MSRKKISQLTALSGAIATTDLLCIVDDPSGTPETKKMTVQDFLQYLPASSGVIPLVTASNGDIDMQPHGTGKVHVYRNDTATTGALVVEQEGTGDCAITFQLTGGDSVTIGIDNSRADDDFRISRSTAFGTEDLLVFYQSQQAMFMGLNAIGTGVGSTAFGHNAMGQGNETGGDNTAFGVNTLLAVTSGAANTAIGADVLDNLTSGSDNTCMGDAAGLAISTQSNNTAVGSQALKDCTAADNSAFGFRACWQNTTGTLNCAFGKEALYTNTTAIQNCAFGAGALKVSNSNNNVAVGVSAGIALTSGEKNTFLGGNTALLATTGSNNIVIGHNIDLPAISTSNMLNIGNAIYATGVNSTTSRTVSTTALFAVGTDTPAANIHSYRSDTATGVQLLVEQASTGDATLAFLLTGGEQWSVGIDNSDGDKFKISDSAALGTTDRLTIDSSGNTTLVRMLVSGGGYSAVSSGVGQVYSTATNGLQLGGSGSSTDLLLLNQSGASVAYIPNAETNFGIIGRLGVGKSTGTTPTYPLDVSGVVSNITAKFDGSASAKLLHLYEDAGGVGFINGTSFTTGTAGVYISDATTPVFNVIMEGSTIFKVTSTGAQCLADLIIATETPATAAASGTQGQIAWDADYIYICTASNTWKRVAIATW